MFRSRNSGDHVLTLERSTPRGMYVLTMRSGITLIHKARFDAGREAWRAFRSSPETIMQNY
jgi:hypothetical protein